MWAPWRNEYVTGGAQRPGCVFCDAFLARSDEGSLVVHSGTASFVVMNRYPYNAGHVMIAPLRHIGRLQEATFEELSEIMGLARKLEGILTEAYHPDGINVGMNLGRSAGAGVADHFHMHLVPRWVGDTNFMTVLADTRVVSEDPIRARDHLRGFFAS